MDKKLSSAQWLRRFLALTLAVLLLFAAAVYIIDPYYHYRAYDNKYKLDKNFVVPGVVANYDYDTIIIGSSVTQNFDMDLFRQELDCSPIKATQGGIYSGEILQLVDLAQRSGHAENYYICLDISSISRSGQATRFPEYLTDDNVFNDYRYFWGYEAWMRFIPLDLALLLCDKLNIPLPQSFQDARSIDMMGYWADHSSFGKDIVLKYYSGRGTGAASNVDMVSVYDQTLETCDWFIDSLDLSQGQFNFFFPPYSALFWYDMQQQGSFDNFMAQKQHFIERMAEHDNVRVFDFQGADFTTNLDSYMDMSHYDPSINDLMTRCFASGEYEVPKDSPSNNRQRIENSIALVLEHNPEILEIQRG